MSKIRPLKKSFGFAFEGFATAIKREPNFRIHLIIATLALITGYLIGLSPLEWLLLLYTISFVLILELINTSLEAIVNLVSPKIRPYAKIAKDVSASAVLLAAVIAVIVGVVLFLPKLT